MKTRCPNRRSLAASVSTVALALICLAAASKVSGQDFEAYRPLTPESTEGEAKLPDLPKPAAGSTDVLVDELKGLVFVDHPDKVVAGKIDDVAGIHIGSASRLSILRSSAFRKRISPYLGRPISIRELNELARDIIIFYRKNDQPVVDVSIPEQDITDGVVQVVVVEARVGRIRVEDACFFNPCILKRQVYACPGGKIYESCLLKDLDWLNRNPFREVDMELTPGSGFGRTDVVFHVHDRLPWRGYLGYEDTGTQETQLSRMIFGTNWGNALWRDHQAGYQYTTSGDFNTLKAHSGMYSIPFYNRDTLLIYGCYAQLETDTLQNFGNTGMSWQASFRYNRNLRPRGRYEHRLVGGFDFKETNTNLEFGGSQVFDSDADIAQIAVGYHGYRYDCSGSMALGMDMFISPGEFSSDNNDAAFQEIRPYSRMNYIYARMYYERQIRLPYQLLFMGRITGQLADANLLPSETLGFGGFNTIRGYDMRLVNGDRGYIVNLELRTEPIHPGLFGRCRCDELQVLGFFDIGGAMNHTLQPNEPWVTNLASTGIGLRYMMAPNVSARFDYGWQLERLAGQSLGSRAHVGVVLAR